MTKCIIEKVDNGLLLVTKLDYLRDKIQVFEERGSKAHIQGVLYALLEYLGELGSKHDEERIRIIRFNREGEEIVD